VTARFRLTREAERDIIDIYLYSLEQFGADQAALYTDNLYGKFATLAENPALGRDFNAIYSGALRSNQESHAIYFKEDEAGILILRVLHQKMDPARHLGDPSG
jgi:toxin ParE1/3/4